MQQVISTIVETGVMSPYTNDGAGLWQRGTLVWQQSDRHPSGGGKFIKSRLLYAS